MERFRIFALVDAAFSIVLFLIFSLPLTLGLTALQHSHGQLPGVVIGAGLGANTALGLGLGVPLGLYLTCGLLPEFFLERGSDCRLCRTRSPALCPLLPTDDARRGARVRGVVSAGTLAQRRTSHRTRVGTIMVRIGALKHPIDRMKYG